MKSEKWRTSLLDSPSVAILRHAAGESTPFICSSTRGGLRQRENGKRGEWGNNVLLTRIGCDFSLATLKTTPYYPATEKSRRIASGHALEYLISSAKDLRAGGVEKGCRFAMQRFLQFLVFSLWIGSL